MTKIRMIIVPLLLLMTLSNSAVSGPFDNADWKEGEIAKVLDRTDGLKGLISEFRDNRNLGADVRDTIGAYNQELQRSISEDQNGLVAFLGNGQCGAGSPGARFHADLSNFLQSFQSLGTAFGEVDANPFFKSDLDVEFGPPSRATCTILFPVSRAFDRLELDISAANVWLSGMAADVSILAGYAKENQCDIIVDNEDAIQGAAGAISVAGIVLENLGAKLKTRKQKDINIAIWGWAGFTIKASKLKKIGEKADSYGDSAKALTDFVGTKLRHCQLTIAQEAILANQREILRNQEALIGIGSQECWIPPGQKDRDAT